MDTSRITKLKQQCRLAYCKRAFHWDEDCVKHEGGNTNTRSLSASATANRSVRRLLVDKSYATKRSHHTRDIAKQSTRYVPRRVAESTWDVLVALRHHPSRTLTTLHSRMLSYTGHQSYLAQCTNMGFRSFPCSPSNTSNITTHTTMHGPSSCVPMEKKEKGAW